MVGRTPDKSEAEAKSEDGGGGVWFRPEAAMRVQVGVGGVVTVQLGDQARSRLLFRS